MLQKSTTDAPKHKNGQNRQTCLEQGAAKALRAENSLASMVVSGRHKVPSDKASLEEHCLLENQDGKLGHLEIANTAKFY